MSEAVVFPSHGYIIDDVPEDILNHIKEEVEYARENKDVANYHLAGNISTEYYLDKTRLRKEFYDYVFSLVKDYDEEFNYTKEITVLNKALPYAMSGIWANFQKKHEFNPIHDHSGVFSFVIWIKIPYKLTDELTHPCAIKSNNQSASLFSFHFTNNFGRIATHKIPVDKEYEGKIILFPAILHHSVNPFFTSDNERISVAGNIVLDSSTCS